MRESSGTSLALEVRRAEFGAVMSKVTATYSASQRALELWTSYAELLSWVDVMYKKTVIITVMVTIIMLILNHSNTIFLPNLIFNIFHRLKSRLLKKKNKSHPRLQKYLRLIRLSALNVQRRTGKI